MPRSKKRIEVGATEVRTRWHHHLRRVAEGGEELVVTRYGHPIARITPFEEPQVRSGIFGCLAGSVTVHGDIVKPLGGLWEADG